MNILSSSILPISEPPRSFYIQVGKPLMDKALAAIGLLVSAVLVLPVMVMLYVANRGQIFFTQHRPGLMGRPFTIYKFKTMNDRRGPDGQLLPDAERLTKVGAFVRKTSLDEVPQLWNVLRGDVSLVGPRPLLMEYLPLYSAEQAKRHWVRPGITGWAQVNGRNAIAWPQKFALDLHYVQHISFALDLKIIGMTVANVLRAKDINSAVAATMPKFAGEQE